VITEAVLAHPLEGALIGIVSAQGDLDEVLARHEPFLDQAVHRHSVVDQMPHAVFAGIVVGVEMHDPDIALAVDIDQCGDVRIHQRMIASDDERDDPCAVLVLYLGNLAHEGADGVNGPLGAHHVVGGVAEIHDGHVLKRVDHDMHVRLARTVAKVHRGCPDRVRPVGGAAHSASHVGESAEDRDIHLAGRQVGGR
jgi:hypothetical protein